jgi:hypothetical protein
MPALKDLAKLKSDLSTAKSYCEKSMADEATATLKAVKTAIDKIADAFGEKKLRVDQGFSKIAKSIDQATAALNANDTAKTETALNEAIAAATAAEAVAKKA